MGQSCFDFVKEKPPTYFTPKEFNSFLLKIECDIHNAALLKKNRNSAIIYKVQHGGEFVVLNTTQALNTFYASVKKNREAFIKSKKQKSQKPFICEHGEQAHYPAPLCTVKIIRGKARFLLPTQNVLRERIYERDEWPEETYTGKIRKQRKKATKRARNDL